MSTVLAEADMNLRKGSDCSPGLRARPELTRAHEQALRQEFEVLYRAPGVKSLSAACALGDLAILAFYVLDLVHTRMPWIGGAQTLRLNLAGFCAAISAICLFQPRIASRYYPFLFATITLSIMVAACVISYLLHQGENASAFVRGLERSLLICVVVIVGFSRIGPNATIVLVSLVPTIVFGALWYESRCRSHARRRACFDRNVSHRGVLFCPAPRHLFARMGIVPPRKGELASESLCERARDGELSG